MNRSTSLIRYGYGGDSSCVQIEAGDEYMVCDMGSGLRRFGQQVMAEHGPKRPKVYHFFMSHAHWDHIMGFPFFSPAYIPGNTIHIYGGHNTERSGGCFPPTAIKSLFSGLLGSVRRRYLLHPSRSGSLA